MSDYLECGTLEFSFLCANAAAYLAATAACFWFIYKLVRAGSKDKDVFLSMMQIAFFVLAMFTLCSWSVKRLLYCSNAEIANTASRLGSYGYGGQYIVLIGLLWRRLCVAFDDSEFSISTFTRGVYWSLFMAAVVCGMTYLVVFKDSTLFHTSLAVAVMIAAALLVISIVCLNIGLFMYKLWRLSRSVLEPGSESSIELLAVITKLFVLTVVSLSTLVLLFGMEVLLSSFGFNIYTLFINGMCAALDIITNCLSVALGVKAFDPHYQLICAPCNAFCMKWWTRKELTSNNDDPVVLTMKPMNTLSTKSSSSFQPITPNSPPSSLTGPTTAELPVA